MTQAELDLHHKIDMALDVSLRAKGAVMLTADGNIINPLAPEPVTVEEVAHVLSQFCRYGGHCPSFYSVGQHSILVSLLVPQEGDMPFWGLMHDAHEAYFGDWPKPVKNAVPGLKIVEDQVEAHVRTALEIAQHLPPGIKKADLEALAIEMRWLWVRSVPTNPVHAAALAAVAHLSMPATKAAFLERYQIVRHTAPSVGGTST